MHPVRGVLGARVHGRAFAHRQLRLLHRVLERRLAQVNPAL